jgi:hypothetical protein
MFAHFLDIPKRLGICPALLRQFSSGVVDISLMKVVSLAQPDGPSVVQRSSTNDVFLLLKTGL